MAVILIISILIKVWAIAPGEACVGCQIKYLNLKPCSAGTKEFAVYNFSNFHLTKDCHIDSDGGIYMKKILVKSVKLKIEGNIGKHSAKFQEDKACERLNELRNNYLVTSVLNHYGFEHISKCPVGNLQKLTPVEFKKKKIHSAGLAILPTLHGKVNVTVRFYNINGNKRKRACFHVDGDIDCGTAGSIVSRVVPSGANAIESISQLG